MVRVGFKSRANFLFSAMKGDTLGGTTGGIFHASIVHLTEAQFEKLKGIIEHYGYSVERSLVQGSLDTNVDYSCSLLK